jgi:hypothetical protein
MASDASFGRRVARGLRAQARGFSLIEVLAVVLLTALVIGLTANTYLDLSRATQRAMHGTRALRQAGAVLDRVARDLEAAMLVVKPRERDPNTHPWYFFAQSRYASEGSDQLKFMTQNRALRKDDGELRDSKFEVVAYQLVEREGENPPLYDLYRWSSPRLPDGCDTSIPEFEDAPLFSDAPGQQPLAERNQLVAERIERFSVRFLHADGDWVSSWDSCQIAESSALPVAAEIDVALFDESAQSVVDGSGAPIAEAEAPGYKKRVVLQLRPIDLEARFESASGVGAGGEEDEEGRVAAGEDGSGPGGKQRRRTIAECIEFVPPNCESLNQPEFTGQTNDPKSRHRIAMSECGIRFKPECSQ